MAREIDVDALRTALMASVEATQSAIDQLPPAPPAEEKAQEVARFVLLDLSHMEHKSHIIALADQQRTWMAGLKDTDPKLWETVDQAIAKALERAIDDTPPHVPSGDAT